jgi:hypothetical protein
MECLKCGHRIPDKSDKCLYCGAWTRGEVPPDPRTEPSQHVTSSEKTGDNFPGISLTKEEMKYKKLEALPESLRAKVEDMLRKGERESQNVGIKTKISSCNFPELMDRTGPPKKKMSFLSALRILLKKE